MVPSQIGAWDAMTQPLRQPPPGGRFPEVMSLRDPFDTLFAVQVLVRDHWDDALCEPPPIALADARIVLLAHGEMPRDFPGWLAVIASPPDEVRAEQLHAVATRLWLRSPYHREPGPPPEDYVRAGFHALCPPHPPCAFGPRARATVIDFARGRPDPLGRLAEEGRDGFDRWLRICWSTPSAFARAILIARIVDAGAMWAASAIRRLDDARIDRNGGFAALARERDDIAARLDPLAYFVRMADFDAAVEDAEEWWGRYVEAYSAHYRRVGEWAEAVIAELLPGITAADVLRVLNSSQRRGAPVGDQALARLDTALAEIRALTLELPAIPMPGVVLGAMPAAFGEARLAAAAVLAAVDVQRRRASA